MPSEIQRLADNFLSNPIRVEVSRPATAATTVSQFLVMVGREPADKRAALRALIRGAADFKNAIIFCNRKRDVAVLHRSLARHGFSVGALHGDMDQHARTATLDDFRKDKIALLVASDVAARGLDIPAVSHIFNFDVPTHSEDYIHRIGRTGRAGRSGIAITLASPLDRKYVGGIEKLTGQPIPPLEVEASAERAASFYGHRGDGEERPRHRGDGHRGEGRTRDRGRGGRSRGNGGAAERAARTDAPAEQPPQRQPAAAPEHPVAEHQPVAAERPVAERAQVERPAAQRAPRVHEPRRPRPRRDSDVNDAPTIGLGDHVPSFLLRRTRMPSESSS